MIPIFIASSDRFADAEWMTEFSIRENTSEEVQIYIVRPQWFGMEESGCTGFTNVRYAIPQLCRLFGHDFGIYLDVDMIVTGDIKELWSYRRAFNWTCLADGNNEVSVICSTLQFPDKSTLHLRHKGTLMGARRSDIPLTWNSKDAICPDMKLLHFTGLATQPWFHDHPDNAAVALYKEYKARYEKQAIMTSCG